VFYAIVITITLSCDLYAATGRRPALHPWLGPLPSRCSGVAVLDPVHRAAAFAFAKGAKEWHNHHDVRERTIQRGAPLGDSTPDDTVVCACFWWPSRITCFSGVIGSEFLPTWMKAHSGSRHACAQHWPDEGIRVAKPGRIVFVPSRGSAMHKSGGAPDDGTDNTGSLTRIFCGLKPRSSGGCLPRNKEELIAACSANWTRFRRRLGFLPAH